jgi:hypothetical protein
MWQQKEWGPRAEEGETERPRPGGRVCPCVGASHAPQLAVLLPSALGTPSPAARLVRRPHARSALHVAEARDAALGARLELVRRAAAHAARRLEFGQSSHSHCRTLSPVSTVLSPVRKGDSADTVHVPLTVYGTWYGLRCRILHGHRARHTIADAQMPAPESTRAHYTASIRPMLRDGIVYRQASGPHVPCRVC